MFVRRCWLPRDMEDAYRLIDENPWALLVNNGSEGPFATNLPLLLDRGSGRFGQLLGHLARANDHARALFAAENPTLAIFAGPSSYVTPTWYPGRDMPGTFYYMAVHCYGHIRRQEETDLEATLEVLNDRMEAPLVDGWRLDEVPRSEISRRLPKIVGFELVIDRLEAKFKLGQDEPFDDAMAVAERLESSTDPALRQLGAAVRRENAARLRGT